MELFQLRIEPGSGRAFTPSRGSMVVLTHVALCTSSDDPVVDPKDRITVTVSSNNSTSPIALGSVRASGGNEQFSIGGSGLCFSDASRVEVKHNGKTACVCLTGRIEATSVDMSDSEDDGFEEDSEEEDTDVDGEDESDSDEDVTARTRKLAAAAARAYTDANDDDDDTDDDDDDDDDDDSESEDSEDDSDSDEPPVAKKRPTASDEDEDEDDDSEDDKSESESESESEDSSSSDASDEGALPGSKRKASEIRESRFDDARDAKRGGGSARTPGGRGRGGRSPAGRGQGGRSPAGRGGRGRR